MDPPKVEIKEFYQWQIDIIKQLDEIPDERTINWVYDPKGGAGKTKFSKWLLGERPGEVFYTSCGKAADIKYAYNG